MAEDSDTSIPEEKLKEADDEIQKQIKESKDKLDKLANDPEERRKLIEARFKTGSMGRSQTQEPATEESRPDDTNESSPATEEPRQRIRPSKNIPLDDSSEDEEEEEPGDVNDEKKRLDKVLKDSRIKNRGYIIQKYFDRLYVTRRRAAVALNDLMLFAENAPKNRQIAISTYFSDLSNDLIKRIFDEEQEGGEETGVSPSRTKDDTELVTIFVKDERGNVVVDAITKKPVMKQITKGELYWSKNQPGSGNSSNSSMEMAEMMTRSQSEQFKQIFSMKDKETNFWQQAAARDPLKSLDEDKKRLISLGIVGEPERPSQYQKVMIDSTRDFMKEGWGETKGELKPLVDAIREDIFKPLMSKVFKDDDEREKHGAPKEVKPLKSDEKDEMMAVLGQAADAEIKEQRTKKVKGGK